MPSFQSFAILPAAGLSRRMGHNKLLLPWDDSTVLQRVLTTWKSSHVDRVVVVIRPAQPELAQLCRQCQVDVAELPDETPEMKVSVQYGLRYVAENFRPRAPDVWLLAPADTPQISTAVINQVLAAHDEQDPAVLVAATEGRRGHPVLFSWMISSEVFQLPENSGVNALLKTHPVREVPCVDQGIFGNLNTLEDYRRMHGPDDN